VLEEIKAEALKGGNAELSDYVFICVQHILPTNVAFFENLFDLGAKPENIYILGKSYSTIPECQDSLQKHGCHVHTNFTPHPAGLFESYFKDDVAEMWERVTHELQRKIGITGIVVIDDGLRCIGAMPWNMVAQFPIIGIEQTTRGLRLLDQIETPVPVVEVASSYTKTVFESPFIGKAVIDTSSDLYPDFALAKIAVVGVGNIGQAIVNDLENRGVTPNKFDLAIAAYDFGQILRDHDIIYGASGTDITDLYQYDHRDVTSRKLLVSASSEDVEFNRLIKAASLGCLVAGNDSVLSCEAAGGTLDFFKAGFPANFNNEIEVEPAALIELTRCLMFQTVLQCNTLLRSGELDAIRHPLDLEFQNSLISRWQDRIEGEF